MNRSMLLLCHLTLYPTLTSYICTCSYTDGCNKTRTVQGGTCEERFKTDWKLVYQTSVTPALEELVWCALGHRIPSFRLVSKFRKRGCFIFSTRMKIR